jgi:hypothetical protein
MARRQLFHHQASSPSSAMQRQRNPSSSRVVPGSSHRPPSCSTSAVAVSRSSTTRSRCIRIFAVFASGTRRNPRVRPSSVGARMRNSPSPIVVSTSTPSNPHQNGARLPGSFESIARYPTFADISVSFRAAGRPPCGVKRLSGPYRRPLAMCRSRRGPEQCRGRPGSCSSQFTVPPALTHLSGAALRYSHLPPAWEVRP